MKVSSVRNNVPEQVQIEVTQTQRVVVSGKWIFLTKTVLTQKEIQDGIPDRSGNSSSDGREKD